MLLGYSLNCVAGERSYAVSSHKSLLPIAAMTVAAFGLKVKAICSNPAQPKRLR